MFLALRDLRSARGRFGLMIAVVALLSLLVVLLTGLTAGLAKQSVGALDALPADHIALVAPSDDADATFDTSTVSAGQVQTLRDTDGVESAAPLGITTSRVNDTPVAVFGTVPGAAVAPDGLRDGTVVASSELDVSVGDTLEIGGGTYEVAEITDDATFNHLPVVWTTLRDWQQLPGNGDTYASAVALTTGPGYDIPSVDGTTVMTRSEARSAVGSYSAENGSLTMIRVLLLAVSALVVGAFFTVWTIQRTPDLAVLKAIGADTTYLVRDALAQAAIVLLVGGALGTAVGALAGASASSAVPFVVAASTTIFPLALLVVLGLVGASAALRRIATVDPLTALGAAR